MCKTCQQNNTFLALEENKDKIILTDDLSQQTYQKHIVTSPTKPCLVIAVDEGRSKSTIPPSPISPITLDIPCRTTKSNDNSPHLHKSPGTRLIMPDKPSYTTINTLLVDEIDSYNTCNVCGSSPASGNDMLNCNQCNLSCHLLCMDNKIDEDICLSCTATNAQLSDSKLQNKPEIVATAPKPLP